MLKINAKVVSHPEQRGSVVKVKVETPDRNTPLEVVAFQNRKDIQTQLLSLSPGNSFIGHGALKDHPQYGISFVIEEYAAIPITENKIQAPVFFNAEETRYTYTLKEIVDQQVPRPKAKYYKAFNAPSWENSTGHFYMTTLEREAQRAKQYNLAKPRFTKWSDLDSMPDNATLVVVIANEQLGILKENGPYPYLLASTDAEYRALAESKAGQKESARARAIAVGF